MASSGTWQMLRDLRQEGLKPATQGDFWCGALVGLVFTWAGWTHPTAALRAVSAGASVVGVVLGSVIAGIAIQTAFLDQEFLRKISAIGQRPMRYFAPFLYTALLGIGAITGLVILEVVSPSWPRVVIAAASGVTWFLAAWCVASLVPALAMVPQFAELKRIASERQDPADRREDS